jgi:hypothetical protein
VAILKLSLLKSSFIHELRYVLMFDVKAEKDQPVDFVENSALEEHGSGGWLEFISVPSSHN